MNKHILIYIFSLLIFPSIPVIAQDNSGVILKHFEKLIKKGDLLQEDIQWEIISQHVSSTSQINHIYFNQTLNGIQILNTASSLHLFSDGTELTANINFLKECSKKASGRLTSSIEAKKAIELVASQLNYKITEPLERISEKQGKSKESIFSKGGISRNEISAKLKYWENDDKELVLVWEIQLLEPSLEHSWNVLADTSTGNILNKTDGVINCNLTSYKGTHEKLDYNKNLYNRPNYKKPEPVEICQECYEVVAMPLESAYFGNRSVVINPENKTASPYGWHDTNGIFGQEFNTTTGNNVDVYIGNPYNYGYQPNGGVDLEFTEYEFDQVFSLDNRFQNASITNLFYWANLVHDVSYIYGFDEVSGNFQQNNYNKGGLDNDAMTILGQNNVSLCNAAFINSPDGGQSFVRMNVCGNKDGSFDNLVLIHEYAHGISLRLTGARQGVNCFSNKEGLGEGISDWYGLMFTLSSEDIGTTPRGYATYLFNEGPEGGGIRPFPYSTSMRINPLTYDSIKEYTALHHVGSVWGTILWDLTWKLIDEYGFDENIYNFTGDINKDAGNIMALALVTEALKLQTCYPGFVDGRDAILLANQIIYGGSNDCVLWEAFAKRGLGDSAFQGSSTDFTDGIEAFDLPSKLANFDFSLENICSSRELIQNINGGTPLGGIYNGTGVIDDGNGKTFSFDPGLAGAGIHTITYEIQDSRCSFSSMDSGTIEVILDESAPNLSCLEDSNIIIPFDEDTYILNDFTSIVSVYDNCDVRPVITQDPIEGTPIGIGENSIKITATDAAGNYTDCTFIITVEKERIVGDDSFKIFPNPATDKINLFSTNEVDLLSSYIFDVNGRLVQFKQFNEFGYEKTLDVGTLSTGLYFVKIESERFNAVRQFIKK